MRFNSGGGKEPLTQEKPGGMLTSQGIITTDPASADNGNSEMMVIVRQRK